MFVFMHMVQQDQGHLAAGCLDGQLRCFSSTGAPKFKERALEGDPLSLALLGTEYLLAGGSDKCVVALLLHARPVCTAHATSPPP